MQIGQQYDSCNDKAWDGQRCSYDINIAVLFEFESCKDKTWDKRSTVKIWQ